VERLQKHEDETRGEEKMEEDGKDAASEHLSFIEKLNTERPTLVFFLLSRNLSNHMDRQAHTRDKNNVSLEWSDAWVSDENKQVFLT
jgi:hypothetical protein